MSTVAVIVGFAAFAAAGTTVRVVAAHHLNDAGRPLGTLGVNLTGSLLLGLAVGLDDTWATVVATAGIGALTTWSTFVAELVALHRDGDRTIAGAYLVVTLGLCTALAWLGLQLA